MTTPNMMKRSKPRGKNKGAKTVAPKVEAVVETVSTDTPLNADGLMQGASPVNLNVSKENSGEEGEALPKVAVTVDESVPLSTAVGDVLPLEARAGTKEAEISLAPVIKATSAESLPTNTTSNFESAIKLASEDTVDTLHLNNVIATTDTLLSITNTDNTSKTYNSAGKALISLIRSLSTMSDKVFILAFEAILNECDVAIKRGDCMLMDEINAFKMFNTSKISFNASHPQFIRKLKQLAVPATRKKYGKTADFAVQFAVLPDSKQTRIRDLFRS